MIYKPLEDSHLLQKTIKKYLNNKSLLINILDMGSGSGIQALTCKELGFKNILAVDINQESIDHIKSLKLKTIKSNLFSNIKEKFNLIIFNSPYLPFDKREPKDSRLSTTAGKKGNEIIIKFLNKAKPHLKPDASILLLFSSLSQPKIILKESKKLGYNHKLLNKQKHFFEELYVFEFTLKDD